MSASGPNPGSAVPVVSIPVEQAWGVRHEVMWPEKPASYVHVAGDRSATTAHFGVMPAAPGPGPPVAVISLFFDGAAEPGCGAQFRKLATQPGFRCRGFGSALVRHAIVEAQRRGAATIRCNARAEKTEFYRRFGLAQTGESFEKGGRCFVVMARQLDGEGSIAKHQLQDHPLSPRRTAGESAPIAPESPGSGAVEGGARGGAELLQQPGNLPAGAMVSYGAYCSSEWSEHDDAECAKLDLPGMIRQVKAYKAMVPVLRERSEAAKAARTAEKVEWARKSAELVEQRRRQQSGLLDFGEFHFGGSSSA